MNCREGEGGELELGNVGKIDWGGRPPVDRLIMAIGTHLFPEELFRFLRESVGADYCTVFHFQRMAPNVVASLGENDSETATKQSHSYVSGGHWRNDPAYTEMQKCISLRHLSVTRLDVETLPHGALRSLCERGKIRDKILICGGSVEDALGISILRSIERGPFLKDHLAKIAANAGTLLAITSKHRAVNGIDFSVALSSLRGIEEVVGNSSRNLPKREVEVCARIIYGVCAAGIASELGISEETVVTYRKRIYRRLHIGTQRELLLRYMSAWRKAQH